MDTAELLRALPKVELHLHLEGSVDANTFAELASKRGVELPAHDEPADLYDYGDLTEFLVAYSLVCASMRDRADFHRVTYECLARCGASGARYVELFFSPDPHLELGVEYPTMLDGILAAFDDAEADLGVVARLVPAINRELGGGRAVELVELVADHRTDRVIGVGLDFNEDGYPPELFVDAYGLAARRGLRRTSHAGEVGPAANVRTGIELLGCERVDHGYHVVDDPALLAELAERRVPFTVCPTTTTYTTVFRDLSAPDHAIRRMFDGGLLMTVASDDPPMFGVDLATEYQKLTSSRASPSRSSRASRSTASSRHGSTPTRSGPGGRRGRPRSTGCSPTAQVRPGKRRRDRSEIGRS